MLTYGFWLATLFLLYPLSYYNFHSQVFYSKYFVFSSLYLFTFNWSRRLIFPRQSEPCIILIQFIFHFYYHTLSPSLFILSLFYTIFILRVSFVQFINANVFIATRVELESFPFRISFLPDSSYLNNNLRWRRNAILQSIGLTINFSFCYSRGGSFHFPIAPLCHIFLSSSLS